MRRLALTMALALSSLLAFAGAAGANAAPDPAVAWNRTLVALLRTPGLQPATVHSTRSYALLHVAIFDAVESIARRYQTYGAPVRAPRGASRRAAADAAAHDVLIALFPSQETALDAAYDDALAAVPAGRRRHAGVAVGRRAARRVLRLRAHDGSDATPPAYMTTGAPGDYRPTPPAFAPPVFTHWAAVTPWALRADQFRPAPPPPLSRALDEVRRLGAATGSERTDEQTEIARFWSAPIQDYWNEIAEHLASGRLEDDARLFAQLDMTLADGAIALYDAKYVYRVWRPITALQQTDPSWTPLLNTPPDPSYPGAHSVISAAAAEVLGGRGPFAVTSPVLAGVTRRFATASAAVQEAGLSRIYAGVHTRPDHTAGVRLGRDVARWVLGHAFQPRRR